MPTAQLINEWISFLHSSNREHELKTEACAQLSVRNCSRFSLPVCSGGGEIAGGRGVVSRAGGHNTLGERIWSSLGRQKVKRQLLLTIHILRVLYFAVQRRSSYTSLERCRVFSLHLKIGPQSYRRY